jgi:Tol biopolymer transport system component
LRAEDWSPDGRVLLYNEINSRRLFALPTEAGTPPQEIAATPYPRSSFRFSPDGRYVAYVSEESGRREVFVASFPSFSEKRQVSVDGGTMPVWRKDGRELFFLGPNLMLTAASVEGAPKLQAGPPKPLFRAVTINPNLQSYDVTGDGQRFLVLEVPENNVKTMVTVNWAEGLKEP